MKQTTETLIADSENKIFEAQSAESVHNLRTDSCNLLLLLSRAEDKLNLAASTCTDV